MQIHELNNFTGTLGSGAYLAVDDGNDTGKLSTQQLLSATEARIDNIIAGPAPSAEEIVDARLGADGVTYPSLGDAIRDQVSDLKADINDITTVGLDLFDSQAIKSGYRLKNTDEEAENSVSYYSDYIPVAPSTTYKYGSGYGSSTYYTVLYYDSSKAFLSGFKTTTTGAFTDTTPSGCAYIRLNGAIARISNQYVALNSNTAFSPHQIVIDGKNTMGVSLVSTDNIFYDKPNGVIKSKSSMIIHAPDGRFNIGTEATVGTGNILWWNKKSGALYASDTMEQSKEVYLLAFLGVKEANPLKQFCTIDSRYPIFTIKRSENKLKIEVKQNDAYILYNGSYYTLSAGYTQTITLGNHCYVSFDPINTTFNVYTSFSNDNINAGIPVFFRYYNNIYCNVAYNTEIDNTSSNSVVCYGDSLTWYDGNAYTWGEHQDEICIGFETYLKQGFVTRYVTNRGSSGKTTPQICALIESANDLATFNTLLIMGGDNDDRLDVAVGTVEPIGSDFDTSTICGALQSAIEYALNANPSIRVVLMTEPMGWTYRNNAMERVSALIPQAYRDVAKLYALPLVDLWYESGINELTRDTLYADPPSNHLYMYHPNNDGWIRLSKIMVNNLKQIV